MENLLFYKKVMAYLKAPAVRRAREVWSEFLDANAPLAVTVNDGSRRALQIRLEKIEQRAVGPTTGSNRSNAAELREQLEHMFDDVLAEVRQTMKRDSYPRFLRSNVYKALIQRLEAENAAMRSYGIV